MSRPVRLVLGILLLLAGLASLFQAFVRDSAVIVGLALVVLGSCLTVFGLRLLGFPR